MNSHCIMILSVVFPLQYSITAQASSWNGGLPLIQTERGIDSIVADVMLQMHATSLQSSNSTGVTINLRSWKAARHFRHHHHLKNVRSETSFLKSHLPYRSNSIVFIQCETIYTVDLFSSANFWQVQGVLIIIGWGTMLPIGVMIARYFKNFPIAWSEWYSVHIIFQGIGYTLGTIGWGIGICLENTLRLHISKAQRVLSIIVFICTTIQVSPNLSSWTVPQNSVAFFFPPEFNILALPFIRCLPFSGNQRKKLNIAGAGRYTTIFLGMQWLY